MSKKVWVTTLNRPDNLRLFGLSFPNKFDYPKLHQLDKKIVKTDEEKERWLDLQKISLEISKPYLAAKKIHPNLVPTTLYCNSISLEFKFPYFCRTPDGFLLVNQACKNILEKFKLGETEIHQVSFFDLDLNTSINHENYYFLNIAESRNYLIPEKSSESLKETNVLNNGYKNYRLYHSNYKNGGIAINNNALNCNLDLWHDPALIGSIFVSDELKKALDDAGIGRDWLFYKCLIPKS